MEILTNSTVGSAHGKIILMGEHSVVYGEPAIAVPFEAVGISVETTASKGEITIDSNYYQGSLDLVPSQLDNLKATIHRTLDLVEKPYQDLHLAIQSTIPAERGMGSSAAVATATVRSLVNFFNKEISQEELLDIVNEAEKIAHGNPSGIDAWTVTNNDFVYYVKEAPFEKLTFKGTAFIIVADTGQTGQTLKAVSDVASLVDHSPEIMEAVIKKLGKLAHKSKKAIKTGDVHALGRFMSRAHGHLKKLTVSNDALDLLVEKALDAGALGAKLTGGGRGGCMIALAEDYLQAHRIASQLKEARADKVWIYELGGKQ